MFNRVSLFAACGFAFLLPSLVHAGGAVPYGDITIQAVIEPIGDALHGYAEYTFEISNNGKEGRRVKILMPAQGEAHALQRSVEVGAGSTVRLSLFQPPAPALYGENAQIVIDGKAVGEYKISVRN